MRVLLAFVAAASAAFEPALRETSGPRIDYTPQFNAVLAQRGVGNEAAAAAVLAADGPSRPFGRNFAGQLCWQKMNGCAGDVRLYDWARNGSGNVLPVLFTQRNGSTLSGRVWWTDSHPV